MKKFLLLLAATLIYSVSSAQDFPFGQYQQADMDMSSYSKDTTAHAVVLREYGKTWISSADHIPLEHDYHVQIKIFDNKGFSYGDVVIPVQKGDNDSFEEVSEIKGIVFYKDETGAVRQAELDPKKVFRENKSKHRDWIKFALPNVRNGCIVEYSYHLESPYRYNFRNWEFQWDIPKVHSEYEAHIPAIYNYNIALRGPLKLSNTKAEVERECFSYYGTKADCSDLVYSMDNIPAFVEEDYMTSRNNFVSAMYFELQDWTDLQNGVKHKVTKEWADIDQDLKHEEWFGTQLKRKELMKDRIQSVIAGKTDDLTKAKAVYEFIQKNFKWNKIYDIGSVDGIRKAFDNHTGNVADINLTLITALNAAGINTDAVLLSTRENGVINKLFPVISDFNYVIGKTEINGQTFMLDATDPLLSFGMLPLKCINDQGRVISLTKASYWIDMVAPVKKQETMAMDLTLQENGKLKGTVTSYSIGYRAYEKRKAIKKFNSIDEYVEDLDEKMPKIKILKSEIDDLDSLDRPLTEKYEVEIDAFNGTDKTKYSFNPYIFNRITTNPFKLAERTYPVDWGMPAEARFILTVHLPDQFKIEAAPQDIGVAIPNNGGRFITNFASDGNVFTFSNVTQFSKSVYSSGEYPYLKELYNKIIQAEKSEIVFSKK